MDKKIYLVVPKLIKQPTWGGDYILKTKRWIDKKLYKNLKIGQSYELFSGSFLRGDVDSTLDPSFTGEFGEAMLPKQTSYAGDKNKLISLSELIQKNPLGTLGKKAVKRHGQTIRVLIKFTQAKGNSFQIHVREEDRSDKWKFKAESWCFFEPGLVTLGIKKDIDWKKYRQHCHEINNEMKKICLYLKSKKLKPKEAKLATVALIDKYRLTNYVNLIRVNKNELVDLSEGGVHHSWEENKKLYPEGNILYELCLDVMDPISVIRSYDKGKINPDGSLRKLDIDDYFQFIDRSPAVNDPQKHLKQPRLLFQNSTIRIESLFNTKYYCLNKLTINGKYGGEHCRLNETYHHLFIKKGKIKVEFKNGTILLSQGHSCFIPNNVNEYQLLNLSNNKSEILKTFIS